MKYQLIKEKTLEDSVTVDLPIAYVGKFDGYNNGSIELTSDMFKEAVKNFNIESLKIPVYKGHADCQMSLTGEEAPSMGWILGLSNDDKYLYAKVEFTKEMETLIKEGKFKYCSIYMRNDVNRETGEDIGMRLFSLAVTNQPFLDELPEIKLSKNQLQNNIYCSKGIEMKKIKFAKDDVTKETLDEAKESEVVMEDIQESKTEDSKGFDPVTALEEARNAMDPEMSMEDFINHIVSMLKAPKEEEEEKPEIEVEMQKPATEEEVIEEEKKEVTMSKTVKDLNIALSLANKTINDLKKQIESNDEIVLSSIVGDAVKKGKLLPAEKDVFIALGKSNKKLFEQMLEVRDIKPAIVLGKLTSNEQNDLKKDKSLNNSTVKLSSFEMRLKESFEKSKRK